MTHENQNHQPEDPMMRRMSGAEHKEQDPRALLAEAQMTWMSTGLEPWFQKQMDTELAAAYDFHDPEDPDGEDWSASIKFINLAKNGESPTLVSAGYRAADASPDTYAFDISRKTMNNRPFDHVLTSTEAKITKLPDGSAQLSGEWNNSETLPVSPELASKIKRLVEIDMTLHALQQSDSDANADEQARNTEQALAFLSSIED